MSSRGMFVGIRPAQHIKRIAVCPKCKGNGPNGYVETDLPLYTCPCGATVKSFLANVECYQQNLIRRREQELLDAADSSHASFARQLHLDPEEEEDEDC